MIVTMIEPSIREASGRHFPASSKHLIVAHPLPTDLETYLLRALGIVLVAMSVYALLLSGAFPLPEAAFSEHSATATTIENPVIAISPSAQNPIRKPTMVVTTVYHLATAFGCYTRLLTTGQYTFLLGVVGSGVLGMFGVWSTLFGDDQPGAKSRSSGWMFPTAQKRGAKMQKREDKWASKGL